MSGVVGIRFRDISAAGRPLPEILGHYAPAVAARGLRRFPLMVSLSNHLSGKAACLGSASFMPVDKLRACPVLGTGMSGATGICIRSVDSAASGCRGPSLQGSSILRTHPIVIPAKAGIQRRLSVSHASCLDSRMYRHDGGIQRRPSVSHASCLDSRMYGHDGGIQRRPKGTPAPSQDAHLHGHDGGKRGASQ